MRHAVRGNGIHPNNQERKGTLFVSTKVHQRIKSGQKEKAPSTTEDRPTRCPNPFHYGANPKPAESRSNHQADQPCCRQPARLGLRRAVTAQYSTCNQAQNHRSQRRNETQGRIPTRVEGKWFFARNQIQKPG